MDKYKIYLVTLYDRQEHRCGLFLAGSREQAKQQGMGHSRYFGNSFKVWECKEIDYIKGVKSDT